MRVSYFLLLLAFANPVHAKADWTRAAPFSAPASELREAATAAQPDETALAVLFVEERWTLDEAGRVERTRRVVYQIRAESAIRAWGYMSATWEPWYQERPELGARVLGAGGDEHLLQPEGIRETPVGKEDHQTYTESRRVQAVIPGVAVGAVVETLVTWRDRDPYFSGGRSLRIGLDGTWGAPLRVVVDVPAAQPVVWALQAEGARTKERKRSGRRIIEVFAASPPEAEWRDLALPAQVDASPHLRVSVAGDWSTIASEYGKVIDGSADAAGIQALVEEVRAAGPGREERLAAAVAIARDRVRYTALELGVQSIVPWGPAETVRRGYGDCKDKATLLVTLLRAVGIDADVVLVRSMGVDIDPGFPGLEAFDHVIVRVGGESTTWVDPTSTHTPLGALPVHLQDRFALVAREGERAPTRLPRSSAADNVIRIDYEYLLPPHGGASLQASFSSTGWIAETYRAANEHRTPAATQAWAERWAALELRQGKLASVERTGWGTDEPVATIHLEVTDAEACESTTLRASCKLNFGVSNAWLPAVMTSSAVDANEGEPLPDPLEDREAPFVVWPHRVELRAVLRFDPILTPVRLPESRTVELGDARVGIDWQLEPDRVIGLATLDTGDGVFTSEEARALRDLWLDSPLLGLYTLDLAAEPTTMLARGERVAAFARIASWIDANPNSAYYRRVRVSMLVRLGLMESSLADSESAVAAEPEDALAWLNLAVVRSFDVLGRERTAPYDRAGAIFALERALELEPEHEYAAEALAKSYLIAEDGFRTVHRPDLERALSLLDARAERGRHDLDMERYAIRLQLGWREDLARDLPSDGDAALAARITTAALQGGVSAAVAVAERAPGERRWKAVSHAAATMALQGHVSIGRDLAKYALNGSPNDVFLRHIAGVTSEVSWVERHAAAAGVERAHLEIMAAGFTPSSEDAVYARSFARPDLHTARFKAYAAAMHEIPLARREAVSDPRNLYLLGGELSFQAPTAAGWRVRYVTKAGTHIDYWYIVDDGVFKLYHASNFDTLPSAAMWLLEQGRVEAARELLALELGSPTSFRRSSLFEPTAEAPTLARVPDDPDELAFALTMLLAREGDEGALARLREAYRSPATPNRVAVRQALYDGYFRAGDVDGVVAIHAELPVEQQRSVRVCDAHVGALIVAARVVEAREALDACEPVLAPQVVKRKRSRILLTEGADAEALEALFDLATSPHAEAYDMNGYAWHALMLDVETDRALDFARRAVASRPNDPAAIHTLACLYARSGLSQQALEHRDRYIALTEPGSADRQAASLILGLLAEAHGLDDEARAAYGAVPKSDAVGSSWSIAERRLGGLDARPAPP